MTVTTLPIANGFYQSDSLPISAQRCIGWYPVVEQAPALSQETLRGTPGSTQVDTTGDLNQANRGGWTFEDVGYFVNGEGLYRLEADETLTLLGVIVGTNRVVMVDNGTQLFILVPGVPSYGYVFTTGPDTLTPVTDPDFKANGEPQQVTFNDGYFVFTTNSKKFIISALNDGLTYSALDVGTAEANPDETVVPIVYRNQLFIGGSLTLEGFQNIGGSDFPYQRSGLFIDRGVRAPFSVAKLGGRIFFIGSGKDEGVAIWELAGNDTTRRSTVAVDSLLNSVSDAELADVFAWKYAEKGEYFICWALPTTTICYDLTTERWHERQSQVINAIGVTETVRSRINSLITAYGNRYVGDSQDGRIGRYESDVYREYGGEIIRPFTTQPFQNNMESFLVSHLELTLESGVGNADVPDPHIKLEISKDGGKTWANGRVRRLGKVGEYQYRAIWRRIGRAARFDVYRFTLSAAVKPVVIQLTADILPGNS